MHEWVIDTSVFVAGMLSRRGAAARLVDAIFADALRPVYVPAVVVEYAEVLARPELDIPASDRWALLLKLRSTGILVSPVAASMALPDEDDRPFIEAALATSAKVVVTLNTRDFTPAKVLGVRILTPGEAVRLL